VLGEINTPLSQIDTSSRQKKIKKEILEFNDTIDLMDLTDVYRLFHPATAHIHSSQQPMELSPK
jgi:hypothetical protein